MPIDKVGTLQEKLYAAAKTKPKRRFHALRDKMYRMDILEKAWKQVRENRGAPGVDGVTIEDVEEQGVDAFLGNIQHELKTGTYCPAPVRRAFIPKSSGGQRPLGIPTIKDKVVQTAAKIVLEPIFEADFLDCSYGYRPNRSAIDASAEVHKWLNFGLEYVVDADIERCFDEIPHDRLIDAAARRISDGYILGLIRRWLKAGVMMGGVVHDAERGTPQGGVISPLLANTYLHQLDTEWKQRGMTRRYGANAQLVRYADDLVVLTDEQESAERALEILKDILSSLGLSLSERKTKLTRAEKGFDFLGFRFVRRYSWRWKKRVTHFFPSPKAVKRVKEKIRERASNRRQYEEPKTVVQDLNRVLIGWANYYRHSFAYESFQKVESYGRERLRRFLRRRRQKSGLGRYRDVSNEFLFEELGLVRIGYKGAVKYARSRGVA